MVAGHAYLAMPAAPVRPLPFPVRCRFLFTTVSRPLPTSAVSGRHAAMPPGKSRLPAPCQCVALYQPVFWMLFTTIPLVLGVLVEIPE